MTALPPGVNAGRVKMATTYIKCCNKLHEVIQFTTKGPIQYGAECSVCGRRVAAETPEDVGWKWEKMEASGLPDMTLEEAEKLWPETDYAYDAANQVDNPLNTGDATAFFLEGYLYARKLIHNRSPREPQT